jgi:phosphate transport system protein
MLSKNEQRLAEVRKNTAEILEDLLISQRLVLHAIEECDPKSFDQVKIPLKTINKKVDDVDSLILKIFALYSPEASDLREMVAFLKITSNLQRIAINEKNYINNMEVCNADAREDVKKVIKDSLSINRCAIKALEYAIDMLHEVQDKDRLQELASKIDVENSKTDDIYSLIEKDALQIMHKEHVINEEILNLLKNIRKNSKIIDRLDDIASRLIFARIGGTF